MFADHLHLTYEALQWLSTDKLEISMTGAGMDLLKDIIRKALLGILSASAKQTIVRLPKIVNMQKIIKNSTGKSRLQCTASGSRDLLSTGETSSRLV
jgi:hypothetical protein